jgi:glycosyltransferase involved in cell wall biosynthesis
MNGMVRLIHNHASGLARRKNDVYLITPMRKASKAEETIDGVHVLRVAMPQPRSSSVIIFRMLALVRGLSRIWHRTGRIEVAYCLGIIPGMAAFIVRPFMGFKIALALDDIASMRDQRLLAHRLYRMAAIMMIRLSDVTIFPTFFARDFVLGTGKSEGNKVTVIPPGTDLRFFTSADRSTVQKGLILYAGGIRARKGLDVLIKSMSRVSDRVPEAHLTLVGGGYGREALETLTAKLGVTRSVTFTGRVSESELKQYHSRANIYVMPTQFDTYPTSLVEAMAMKKPVITTRVSAPAEVIEDGKNGLLVQAGDVDGLAEAIESLLKNEQYANRMADEARKTVEEKYDLEKSISSLESVFKSLRSQKG